MYDITIVGAGMSGIFLAYTLLQTDKKINILMLEKGVNFADRICPIEKELSPKCINCKICNKLQGFGGMGRSEGKFNYTNNFGGDLGKKIGNEKAIASMETVDKILCSFGADKVRLYNTKDDKLFGVANQNNCSILTAKVRHLGTALSYEIIEAMYVYLKSKIDIKFKTDVISIDKKENIFNLHTKDTIFQSKLVVLATGISGGKTFDGYCSSFGIKPYKSRVDLGIRVEMKGDQLDAILQKSFETKIRYKSDEFEATTYCMNPKGRVIKKHQNNLVLADGQNYLETDKPSDNLNFTIFVPKYFTDAQKANESVTSIVKAINKDRNRIVVQRLEDLICHKATTKEKIINNSIQPTLDAEGGNLYDEIPAVYIDAALKIFELIVKLTGKKNHSDTLLYGVDCKFYEPEINVNEYFETKEQGLYVVGDCSGITNSLSQAAASAVYLGECLLTKISQGE